MLFSYLYFWGIVVGVSGVFQPTNHIESATDQNPKARKEWVAYAQEATIPLASRDSDDFADLMFLKEQIGDRRIVWLGENAHGVNDNNVLKFRLIRFLNQEMGFKVVAFEGGVANCGLSNIAKDSLSGMRLLVHSVMGSWRVKANCELFDYMKRKRMEIAGVDPNNNALYLPREHYRRIFPGNEAIADLYFSADSLQTHYVMARSQYFHGKKADSKTSDALDNIRKMLLLHYQDLSRQLKEANSDQGVSERSYLMHQKAIESREQVLQKANTDIKAMEKFFVTFSERDSLMARNLDFLADTLYPKEKIIVWAYNGHISKKGYDVDNRSASMGDFLSPANKAQSFVIGLFTSHEYLKPKTESNSLEAILALTTHKTGYIPILTATSNTAGSSWLYSSLKHGYVKKQPLPLSELFDGILFMNGVEKSKLIPFNKEFRCDD